MRKLRFTQEFDECTSQGIMITLMIAKTGRPQSTMRGEIELINKGEYN